MPIPKEVRAALKASAEDRWDSARMRERAESEAIQALFGYDPGNPAETQVELLNALVHAVCAVAEAIRERR